MNKKILKKYIKNFINESLSIGPQIEKARKIIYHDQAMESFFENLSSALGIKYSQYIDSKIQIYVGPSMFEGEGTHTLEGNIVFSYLDNNNMTKKKNWNFAEIAIDKLPPHKKVFDNEGKERSIYQIYNTYAVKLELGALMYDLLIEYISSDNGVLVSDREMVSDDAVTVWEKYMQRSDIQKAQIDVDLDYDHDLTAGLENTTKDYWHDDLLQTKAISYAEEKYDDRHMWLETPFAKGLYKKDSDFKVKTALENDEKFILTFGDKTEEEY